MRIRRKVDHCFHALFGMQVAVSEKKEMFFVDGGEKWLNVFSFVMLLHQVNEREPCDGWIECNKSEKKESLAR